MTGVRFEWDETKNRANQRKHGVRFEDAAQVFRDPLHLSVQDRIESGEQRWQTFGLVGGFAILMVVHMTTEEDLEDGPMEVIRISARRADRSERRRYEDEGS